MNKSDFHSDRMGNGLKSATAPNPYNRPRLIDYGKVSLLTAGGSGGMGDQASNMNPEPGE